MDDSKPYRRRYVLRPLRETNPLDFTPCEGKTPFCPTYLTLSLATEYQKLMCLIELGNKGHDT